MNYRTEILIRDFVSDFPRSAVRGRELAKALKCSEIRTKKHDHLAVFFDELGNALVLTRKGLRLNLLHSEIAHCH
jgi:hypothetical protein